jgi:acetate kinase
MRKENLSAEEMDEILNKKSGVLGVSGISSDTEISKMLLLLIIGLN